MGVASLLAADLARHHYPDEQWEKCAQDANGLSAKEYNDIARKTQNFLKHADRDVECHHEFDPSDTDALAFGATRNLANFGTLGFEESALELWYIASYYQSEIGPDDELFAHAANFFGDLRSFDRPTRLAKGQAVLATLRASDKP